MTGYTREQIDAIRIGTMIAKGIDGRFGEPSPVVEIFAKQDDIYGKLFVCGYVKFSENAQISFSVKEGDPLDAKLVRIVE